MMLLIFTYNGAHYLRAQLNSIEDQDEKNWTLYVSDDHSKNQTVSILHEDQTCWATTRWIF